MAEKETEDTKAPAKPKPKPKPKKNEGKQRYFALRRMASKSGDAVWNLGAEIWLDDIVGPIHVKKGNARPAEETVLPDDTAAVTVNEAK